ncbi:MAG: peptide deformylase [Candidatus Marinimicrobia bacterium]|nr:peptide deformylase [Candidatus Neomarinimicrobiota bacterium]
MELKIYKYGASILRRKCKLVKSITTDIEKLIPNMIETMYADDGIGLSANQVGHDISLSIIGKDAVESENDLVLINPKILEYSDEKSYEEEGCLSIPDITEKVSRSKYIKLKYQDLDLKEQINDFSDFTARVIQHEVDHLNGVFFTDRISFLKRKLINKKLKQIAEEYN